MASSRVVLDLARGVRLDSAGLVVALVVLAIALVVLVPLRWRSWRRAGRTAVVLVAALSCVLAGAAVVNRAGDFYPTLATLFPSADPPAAPAATRPAAATTAGPGRVRRMSLPAVAQQAVVYLPDGVSGLRFPLVRWLSRRPFDTTTLPARLDDAIRSGHLPPVVVVQADGMSDDALLGWAADLLPVRTDRMARALAGPLDPGTCALDAGIAAGRLYAVAAGRACGSTAAPDPMGQQLLALAAADRPADVAAADARHAAGQGVTEYVFSAASGPDARLAAELRWLGGRLPAPLAEPAGGSDARR